jgi:hypothetical protein
MRGAAEPVPVLSAEGARERAVMAARRDSIASSLEVQSSTEALGGRRGSAADRAIEGSAIGPSQGRMAGAKDGPRRFRRKRHSRRSAQIETR